MIYKIKAYKEIILVTCKNTIHSLFRNILEKFLNEMEQIISDGQGARKRLK